MKTINQAIVISIALTGNLVVSTAYGSCAISPEASDTIVRGRFVRCEDARFHLEASDAYRIHERGLEAWLARVGPENRERLLERLGSGLLTRDFEARVVVVALDWHVPIVPWRGGVSDTVQFKDQPREFHETIRYWWRGSIEACEGIEAGSPIDLWVHHECCDTTELAPPVCIVAMQNAEPVPSAVSEVVSELLGQN